MKIYYKCKMIGTFKIKLNHHWENQLRIKQMKLTFKMETWIQYRKILTYFIKINHQLRITSFKIWTPQDELLFHHLVEKSKTWSKHGKCKTGLDRSKDLMSKEEL